MVAFIPILAIVSSLVGLFAVFQPRLPQYNFRVQKIGWPKIINSAFKTQLGADVKLQNDNFVPIDIHALSFDLFYPDSSGSLNHIGNVHDTRHQPTTTTPNQHNPPQQQGESPPQDSSKTTEILIDEDAVSASLPLWALQPRQSFETKDNVFMQPALSGILGVLSNLSWNLFQHGGTIHVPSSGVIHIKAHSRVPLTLSILCDNTLNTWTMEMKGLTCELDNLELGWTVLPDTVEKLRSKIVNKHLDNKKEMSSLHMPLPDDDEEKNKGLSSINFDEEYEKLTKGNKKHWKSSLSIFGARGTKPNKKVAA